MERKSKFDQEMKLEVVNEYLEGKLISITEVVVTSMDIVKDMEVIACEDVGILTEVLKVK